MGNERQREKKKKEKEKGRQMYERETCLEEGCEKVNGIERMKVRKRERDQLASINLLIVVKKCFCRCICDNAFLPFDLAGQEKKPKASTIKLYILVNWPTYLPLADTSALA